MKFHQKWSKKWIPHVQGPLWGSKWGVNFTPPNLGGIRNCNFRCAGGQTGYKMHATLLSLRLFKNRLQHKFGFTDFDFPGIPVPV